MAGIEVRSVAIGEMQGIEEIQRAIWGGTGMTDTPQLVAASRNGGHVLGAFDSNRMVGFCYGFPGRNQDGIYLVSHMLGVLPTARRRGIAYRLKQAQYRWAAAAGFPEIRWTFDPLQTVNAYFNLSRLGAVAHVYVPNYYGFIGDKLNRGLPTDRLVAEWRIKEPAPATPASDEHAADAQIPVALYPDEVEVKPAKADLSLRTPTVGVGLPGEFPQLKAETPGLAEAWRLAVREVFAHYFAEGYVAVGLRRDAAVKRGGGGERFMCSPTGEPSRSNGRPTDVYILRRSS